MQSFLPRTAARLSPYSRLSWQHREIKLQNGSQSRQYPPTSECFWLFVQFCPLLTASSSVKQLPVGDQGGDIGLKARMRVCLLIGHMKQQQEVAAIA